MKRNYIALGLFVVVALGHMVSHFSHEAQEYEEAHNSEDQSFLLNS